MAGVLIVLSRRDRVPYSRLGGLLVTPVALHFAAGVEGSPRFRG